MPGACAGAIAVMVVAFTTVKLEVSTPPIFTVVAPVRLVPLMVALEPPKMGPALGLTDVTVGTAATCGYTGGGSVPPPASAATPTATPATTAPPMTTAGTSES